MNARHLKGVDELDGMPSRPEPPHSANGREIENARVSVTGGVSFELRAQDAIDYLEGFGLEDPVQLVVHGRVKAIGDGSQTIKDGTLLTRRVTIEVDFIEGSPNPVAEALAAAKADDEDA